MSDTEIHIKYTENTENKTKCIVFDRTYSKKLPTLEGGLKELKWYVKYLMLNFNNEYHYYEGSELYGAIQEIKSFYDKGDVEILITTC